MYKIRQATPGDFPRLLPLANKFYATTPWAGVIECDVPSAVEHYIGILTNGHMIVAEVEGEPVAFLGALIHPFHFNHKEKLCTESMWWVEVEHRKSGIGGALIEEMERLAREAGCKGAVLSMLSTSPPQVGPYYNSIGYSLVESAFFKEL